VIIKIRHQNRVFSKSKNKKREECYGTTRFPTLHRIVITMSRALNRRLASYGATILHELLHVWIHTLEMNGFEFHTDPETAEAVEEEFVEVATLSVLKDFRRIVGRIGRKHNGK
jgi:ssRNA-specific RNase YbeY (16S rRNA maturation enzyme)